MRNEVKNLKQLVSSIKNTFLKMYFDANAGHIGSSLSVAEILTVVWFELKSNNDRVILSKGHAAAALYSTMHYAGIISKEQIECFYKNNTLLPAHPPINKFKEIPFATGSLGHGLSIAAGFGLSNKLRKVKDKVYCITSDGELNEGSTWEAALFINHHKLLNVIWIIDRNRLQGFGATEEVMKLDPLDKKLEAFGFQVHQINGHEINELQMIKQWESSCNKPLAIIANTTKGNGWKTHENTVGCHYLPMKEEDYLLFNKSNRYES